MSSVFRSGGLSKIPVEAIAAAEVRERNRLRASSICNAPRSGGVLWSLWSALSAWAIPGSVEAQSQGCIPNPTSCGGCFVALQDATICGNCNGSITVGGTTCNEGSANALVDCTGGGQCCGAIICSNTICQCGGGGGGVCGRCGESPILLDPFDEGFHLSSLDNGVKFRTQPGGPLTQMSWTDPKWRNGWLALDRNGDGTIDDFTELFGNLTPQPPSDTPNGFLALAVFDDPRKGGNGNGVIDPDDSVFRRLRVWIDTNHNGVSEPGELHTLQDLGISKIGLTYQETPRIDQFGNQFRFKGSVWEEGGAEKDICYDVFLVKPPK